MPPMTLYPAIDLMGGRCVRLSQGVAADQTVYSEDPVAVARDFQRAGAQWIHLVDLDGAFSGESKNRARVQAIRKDVSIKLELGGGMRDEETVEAALGIGLDRVVIGTWAARDPEAIRILATKHGEKIAVGIDARDGKVAVRGWTEVTDLDAGDFAVQLAESGVQTIIATDIATDGMLTGPNVEFLTSLTTKVPRANFIASGGIKSAADLTLLRRLEIPNLTGVIVGRAIYTGALTVEEGIEALL